MSDLISRKALLEELRWRERVARDRVMNTPQDSPCYQRYQAQLTERERLIELLENAPTAFDKEKVLGELMLEAEKSRKYWLAFDKETAFGEMSAYTDAIEIVEKGGIE